VTEPHETSNTYSVRAAMQILGVKIRGTYVPSGVLSTYKNSHDADAIQTIT
jgi:hypothetical protein